MFSSIFVYVSNNLMSRKEGKNDTTPATWGEHQRCGKASAARRNEGPREDWEGPATKQVLRRTVFFTLALLKCREAEGLVVARDVLGELHAGHDQRHFVGDEVELALRSKQGVG